MPCFISVDEIPGYKWMSKVPKLDPSKVCVAVVQRGLCSACVHVVTCHVVGCAPMCQLVYVGLRDLDTFEKGLIKKLGIKTFTMQVRSRLGCPVMSRYSHGAPPVPTQHVDKYGIGKIMEMSLDHLASQVWLTFRAHVASVS